MKTATYADENSWSFSIVLIGLVLRVFNFTYATI